MVFKKLSFPLWETLLIATFIGVIILLSLAFREQEVRIIDVNPKEEAKIISIEGNEAIVENIDGQQARAKITFSANGKGDPVVGNIWLVGWVDGEFRLTTRVMFAEGDYWKTKRKTKTTD